MWWVWVCIAIPLVAYVISYTIRHAPFKVLLRRATAFGVENFNINLKEVVDFKSYTIVKALCSTFKPVNQYSHIEIFFAFGPWLLPKLDQYKREMLMYSLREYSRQGMIEPFILDVFEDNFKKVKADSAVLQSETSGS